MTALWLYQSAFVLQLLSLALFVGYAVKPQRGLSAAATAALGLSAACQILFTLMLTLKGRSLPLGNAFEALNFWALIFSLLALILEWRFKMGVLGAFLAPFSSLLLLAGVRFSHVAAGPPLPAGGAFLFLHVGLPMAGYALFTASAGVAAAWFIEARQLKRLDLGISFELPALETLEQLAHKLAGYGLAGLTVGLASGFWGHAEQFSVRLGSDPKIAMSFMAWLFYAACLLLYKGGLRGKRFASLLLFGFVSLFLFYYLVNVFWGGHSFGGGQ